jgi:hypothetical protein
MVFRLVACPPQYDMSCTAREALPAYAKQVTTSGKELWILQDFKRPVDTFARL